jgi:anti-sigma-K factor RskA
VSLGVLPPIGRNLPARELLAADTQLMISLEPHGGSRTGAPTGPVLWGGRLAQVE